MSRNKQNEDWITLVTSNVIVYAVIGVALVLTGIMLALFALAKQPITKAWGLERHSAQWPRMSLLYKPLKYLAALVFLLFLTGAIGQVLHRPATAAQLALALLYFLPCLACALVFSVLHWLEGYYNNPGIQQKVAGINAERFIQKIIQANATRYPGSSSLHGVLLVFQAGSANEFSVEADHILITTQSIYVIETKYKSGTIRTTIDGKDWETLSPAGQSGRMRNALRQVKNTVRVLERECNLQTVLIPLVAIVGQQLVIENGPSNIVTADALIQTIDAFELMAQEAAEESGIATRLYPDRITAELMRHISTEPSALKRHIERAEQARLRADLRTIAESASLR